MGLARSSCNLPMMIAPCRRPRRNRSFHKDPMLAVSGLIDLARGVFSSLARSFSMLKRR